jgi:hypothetical protein
MSARLALTAFHVLRFFFALATMPTIPATAPIRLAHLATFPQSVPALPSPIAISNPLASLEGITAVLARPNQVRVGSGHSRRSIGSVLTSEHTRFLRNESGQCIGRVPIEGVHQCSGCHLGSLVRRSHVSATSSGPDRRNRPSWGAVHRGRCT